MKKLLLLLVCILLPVQTWAFPDNAVLDNFDASTPDTTPPNANWATGWVSGGVAMRAKGNGVTTVTTNTGSSAYWKPGGVVTNFGPNCEAYVTIVSVTATSPNSYVACRLVDLGTTTAEGYRVVVEKNNSRFYITKVVNGVGSAQLGTYISQTILAGDSFGIRTIGDNICAWYKVGAGAWVERYCQVDSSYMAAGSIGMGANGDSTIAMLDNFGGGTATALCSGASPTWTASSVDKVSVNDCIGLATTGDTVNIPAGTAEWFTVSDFAGSSTSPATVATSKSITLHGETVCSGVPTTCVDNTIIVDKTSKRGSAHPLVIFGTNARVTGISFQDPRPIGYLGITALSPDVGPEVNMTCSNCRFDHNSIVDTSADLYKTHGVFVGSTSSTIGVTTQLFDHNYFKDLNGGVDPHGEVTGEGGTEPNLRGSLSWHLPMTLGDANAVYIEDNNFDNTNGVVADGAYDAYQGARLVFRFNTVRVTNMGGHGMDSGERSTLRQEIYRNIITNPGPSAVYTAIQTRGGMHLIWQNVVPATGGSYDTFMWYTNYRSDVNGCTVCQGVTAPQCSGSSYKDGNTPGGEGYPCRDQVGRGPSPDPGYQTDWPATSVPSDPATTFSEPLLPTYNWGNVYKGATPTLPVDFTGNYQIRTGATPPANPPGSIPGDWTRMQTKHVLSNRDFYIEAADVNGTPNFNGTVGTGTGTLAARPATCTAGVAYFATDQGSWNTSTTDGIYNPSTVAGEDGLLYKCRVGGNNWDLYYTPYVHPHPLQGSSVTAPTGLRLLTQASGNSVCLVWTASDLTNLAGYRIYHGLASGTYDPAVSIPLNSVNTRHMPDTQYCYSSPKGGTHYFSMTAYNNDIVESTLATEVSTTFTALSRTTASARGGSSTRDPLQ